MDWTQAEVVYLRQVFPRLEIEMLRSVPRDGNIAGYMTALDVLRSLTQDRTVVAHDAGFIDMSNDKPINQTEEKSNVNR